MHKSMPFCKEWIRERAPVRGQDFWKVQEKR